MSTTIDDLLVELDRTCRSYVVDPTLAEMSDSLDVVRRIVRYASELRDDGLGVGATERQRSHAVSRLITAGSRVVREASAGPPAGRASALAGAAIDALRTSRPPLTADERWAIIGELSHPMARAVNLLTASAADLPAAVVAHSAIRTISGYLDGDPPRYDVLTRFDDVIPSPIEETSRLLEPTDYADRLSLLAAKVRTELQDGYLNVRDTVIVAETSLAVADAARRTYSAAGLPVLGEEARGCAQAWADLRHHLATNVEDGMTRRQDATIARAAADVHRAALAVAMDPQLARRSDLADQLTGLGNAVGRLPELANCIGARGEQWEYNGAIRVRETSAHPTLGEGRYANSQWANPFELKNALDIRRLAGKATPSPALL